MQSVRVTTNFESRQLCLIHRYVVKFVSYFRQVGCLLWAIRLLSSIVLTEIVLKVELSTITLTLARFQYDETVINYNYLGRRYELMISNDY